MDPFLLSLNLAIKKEADDILTEKGLLAILNSFGVPHLSGSYALNLMTWRDLDIYLETDHLTEEAFFQLGGQIAAILSPGKMSFRNEIVRKTKGLPNGLYWGIYLGDERNGAWKIDIWAVDKNETERLLRYCSAIAEKLTDANSQHILQIKSLCWKDPGYRRSFLSTDIYTAVLENGITNIDEFKEYLKR